MDGKADAEIWKFGNRNYVMDKSACSPCIWKPSYRRVQRWAPSHLIMCSRVFRSQHPHLQIRNSAKQKSGKTSLLLQHVWRLKEQSRTSNYNPEICFTGANDFSIPLFPSTLAYQVVSVIFPKTSPKQTIRTYVLFGIGAASSSSRYRILTLTGYV